MKSLPLYAISVLMATLLIAIIPTDAEAKIYRLKDFISEDSGIDYDFSPNNTSLVIENGVIAKMNKVYMP